MAAIFFVTGCENSGTFTEEVLPVEDHISTHYVDTLPITMTSIWTDVSETYRADRQLFGNYIDPLFGRITAETFTEVLPRSNLDFGSPEDLFYDSIVLKLDIEETYGRFATSQTLHIYELNEIFPEGDDINSQTRLSFDASNDLGDNYQLDLLETKGVAQLTIRLDDELGRRLLFANPDTLGDKDLFKEFFPGLYLGTDPVSFLSREPGGIFSLFGSSSNTQLELHYKQREPGTQVFVSKVEPFLISSSTPRFTYLKRTEFSDTFLAGELGQTSDTSSMYEFLQGGLLIKNFIKFSNIDQLGRVAISRAELVIQVDPSTFGGSERYNPPNQLLPIFADENGDEVLIEGIPILASTEAVYNSTTQTYSISLTNYVQQLVNGQRENFGIILRSQGSEFRINRVVFGGVNNPSIPPKLAITYTTLPK